MTRKKNHGNFLGLPEENKEFSSPGGFMYSICKT